MTHNNNVTIGMGSLETDETISSTVGGNAAMGLISDSGETMEKPVTSWIFSIITGCGLLVFLFVSFYQYHKRLREKRVREHEYMKQFKELLPDCDYNDFKVTRARSVMTNTHFNTYPSKDDLELHIGPRIGSRLFRTIPQFPPIYAEKNTNVELHEQPRGKSHSFDSNDLDFPFMDDNAKEHTNETVYYNDNKQVKKTKKHTFRSLSETKKSVKNKKKRKFLRNIGKQKQQSKGDSVDFTTNQSPYLSDLYLYTEQAKSEYEGAVDIYRSTKSESDISTFVAEDFTNDECSNQLLNDYYIEAGIPRPSSGLNKRRQSSVSTISSSDSRKKNALYDRLTLREDPKDEYKELIHKDATGIINLNARSLPMLDSEHYAVQLQDLPPKCNNQKAKQSGSSNSIGQSESSPRRRSEPLLRSLTAHSHVVVIDGKNEQVETSFTETNPESGEGATYRM